MRNFAVRKLLSKKKKKTLSLYLRNNIKPEFYVCCDLKCLSRKTIFEKFIKN